MKKLLIVLAGLLITGLNSNAAMKVENGDSWMEVKILGQLHFLNEDKAADKDDIYLRRGRIIVSGQIQDGVKGFIETDNPNMGKYGTDKVNTQIQDAFIDYRLLVSDDKSQEHWLKAGLILLPFSFENRAGAGSILGIDYNTEAIKMVNTFVWRDYGAELHGNMGKQFAYFVGAFDGYDEKGSIKNPDAGMRLTGHMAYNLIGEAETGWFFDQYKFAWGNYLAIGAGVDLQSDATLKVTPATNNNPEVTTIRDNEAYVVDFKAGYKVTDSMALILNGAYYDWANASFDGKTAFVEGGLLVSKTMLTLKYSIQDPDAKTTTEDYTVGLHYFFKEHSLRTGIEYRTGDSVDQILAGIQFVL